MRKLLLGNEAVLDKRLAGKQGMLGVSLNFLAVGCKAADS